MMKSHIKTSLILCAIVAFCALLLSVVNSFTSPIIAQMEKNQLSLDLGEVASGMIVVSNAEGPIRNAVEDASYPRVKAWYSLKGKSGQEEGRILELRGAGYGGEFVLIAAFNTKTGALIGAKMNSNNETPGLGKRSEKPEYMAMFLPSAEASTIIPTTKAMLAPEQADAVSGASVTFKGIAASLSEGQKFIVATCGAPQAHDAPKHGAAQKAEASKSEEAKPVRKIRPKAPTDDNNDAIKPIKPKRIVRKVPAK